MSKTKGHMHRTIQTPGYRLHSKWDLAGLRHRRDEKKSKGEVSSNLPLTPMIDMMSILIIFLLMNFSATGEVFFISKDSIKLPQAAHSRNLESAALISITKDGTVMFEAQQVGKSNISFQEKEEELPQLRARLQQLRILSQQIRPNEPFKGQVNIQADRETPLINIKRVMSALISEGWTGINFAVEHGSSRKPASQEDSEE